MYGEYLKQAANVNLDNIAKSESSLYIQIYLLSDKNINYILWDMVTLKNTYQFGNT